MTFPASKISVAEALQKIADFNVTESFDSLFARKQIDYGEQVNFIINAIQTNDFQINNYISSANAFIIDSFTTSTHAFKIASYITISNSYSSEITLSK